MPKKKTGDSTDWTSLKKGPSKNARRKPVSWRARFRSLWVWTKRTAAVALLGLVGYGCYYAYENIYFDEIFGMDSELIRHIELKTDGAISGKWLNEYLKIKRGTKLSDVNIFAVKQSLDALTQIKSSKVERIYPDILRITVSEYKPIAKILLKIDYENRIYLMNRDGIFFSPVCIAPEKIDSLKFIEGMKISFDGKTPAPYAKAKKIEEFFNAARAQMPREFENWNSVDVSQLDSITLPLITVKNKSGVKYIFKPTEYSRQLDRLEYIMKYMRENPMSEAEEIDLTLNDWSVMKLATPPTSKSK